ncbi:MAG: HpcH/HpaI aldolase/citrate lyase family protein [Candidatus Dormibacterales bacterium]
MRPYRSFLFVPGNRPAMLAKAPARGADALLLDLEDAVPAEEKDSTRRVLREQIPDLPGAPVFVRSNSVSSGETRLDLEAVVVPGLLGLFLPKVESTEEVREVAGWLDELEPGAGLAPGTVEIVCMLETALGVRRTYELATASPRVGSVCFASGENGDFQTDLGCDWSVEGTEMLYARSKVVLDARAAGIAHPLDGVFVAIDDIGALVADTTLSKRLGYKGRAIIHPKHVEAVNRIYTPAEEEVRYYLGLLAAFEGALAAGRASVTYEGKMIDYAMAARARQVLALAEALAAGGAAKTDKTQNM